MSTNMKMNTNAAEFVPARQGSDTSSCASAASTVKACFHCKQDGHLKATCPKLRCSYCSGQGHKQHECPHHQADYEFVQFARKLLRQGGWLSKNQQARLDKWDTRSKAAGKAKTTPAKQQQARPMPKLRDYIAKPTVHMDALGGESIYDFWLRQRID